MGTGPEDNHEVILQMQGVSKVFGNVQALESVSLICRAGEVHGLVGENGAGKSTLMKILAGEFQPDEGDILLRGKKVQFKNPRQSKEGGISLIHQEFALVPYLSVAENLFLGKEPLGGLGFIDSADLYERAMETLGQLKIELDLEAPVARLTIGQRQLLEIAKSIREDPQILIMDEPTAALERHEIEILFSLIERIKEQGRTVIFISHRLEEVFEISDQITVLRNGRSVLAIETKRITKDELIEAIIGRKLEKFFPSKSQKRGREIVQVRDLTRNGSLHHVNLVLNEGEILGIAGLEGQGQYRLLRALFGADFAVNKEGEIRFDGRKIDLSHPRYTVRAGFGYVPGDRKTEGLMQDLPVKDNISLPGLYKRTRWGFIGKKLEKEIIEKSLRDLSIKVSSGDALVKYLSGGNQQKVVLAKWLSADTDILILDEPTRGVDIGTRAEIYRILRELADGGKAIIVSSRDLDEVIGMSDRIAIIYRGRIIREFDSAQVSKEQILDLITRVPEEERRRTN